MSNATEREFIGTLWKGAQLAGEELPPNGFLNGRLQHIKQRCRRGCLSMKKGSISAQSETKLDKALKCALRRAARQLAARQRLFKVLLERLQKDNKNPHP